ncbi:MAG: magnesium transporter CorA family protein [Candidatus Algichlamydia australiensis]|nr:magnesium transporter CorA family protein [Chlamydiales bacterium]
MKCYIKNNDDEDFREIDTPEEGCWIHIDEATPSDLNEIAKLTENEYTDLHDCLDKHELPRVERLDEKNVLIFTRHPTNQEMGLYTTTLGILLTPKYFITICPQKSHLVKNLLSQKTRLFTTQKSKFLLYILLKVTQEFTLQIKKIRANVLKKEKELSRVESEDITALTINEENLSQYLSSLVPLRNVFESITSGRYTLLYEKDQDLLEDLLNASIQSEDLCTINLRTIRGLRDSFQIIFTNQLNKTIKLLTSLTIILSIPTMVSSLYGMNVALPFEKNPFAFSGIMLFTVLCSFVALILFQRKKWL